MHLLFFPMLYPGQIAELEEQCGMKPLERRRLRRGVHELGEYVTRVQVAGWR